MTNQSIRFQRPAFTLIELLIVVLVVVVFVSLLIPSLACQRRMVLTKQCQSNLQHAGIAFRTWTGSEDGRYPPATEAAFGGTKELANSGQAFVHLRVMSNELGSPTILVCPADPARTPCTNFNFGFGDSNLSYFVSLDAMDTYPQMFLAGDRNLAVAQRPLTNGLLTLTTNMPLGWTKAIHGSCGNILLSDGSVQFWDSSRLCQANGYQGWATNRLVIP